MALVDWGSYILVVEDDQALRDVYRSALRAHGYAAIGVEDGLDALRLVETQRPAALVLDLALPRLGGRDVQRELKANPVTRNIPIVVVTGTDASDLDPRDFPCVLQKPTDLDALLAAVAECLRRSPRRSNQPS